MATQNFAAHRARLFKPGSGSQAAIPYDPADMYVEFDDFYRFDAGAASTADRGDWVATAATAGTAEIIDGAGGILEIDSGSATQGQGMNVQRKVEAFLPAAGKDIYFEARWKVTDTIGEIQMFVGLSVLDTTIMASNVISSANYIGLLCEGDGQGDVTLSTESGGSQTKEADVFRMVEDTYFTAGFVVAGTSSVQALHNGVPVGDEITTNIPTTELAPSFVCVTDGNSIDPIISLDWYVCAQLR